MKDSKLFLGRVTLEKPSDDLPLKFASFVEKEKAGFRLNNKIHHRH